MEKKCFKCGKVKPLSEFYKHKQMLDGHLNKCKECARNDSLTNRWENIEKVREKDRNRQNSKERTYKNKERLKKMKETEPERYVEMKRETQRKYRKRYNEKTKAHGSVHYAIATGRLINPKKCERCGSVCFTQAHHEDYSKPLVVIWLCDSCHKKRHKEIREEERKGVRQS